MIPVRKRVDVIVYSGTAWPLVDGSIHFRPDIYVADGWLAAALEERPPAAIGTEPVNNPAKPGKTK